MIIEPTTVRSKGKLPFNRAKMRFSFEPDWICFKISFLWPLPKIFFRISKNPGQSLAKTTHT